MSDFPHPLRLAVGSHQRGSGKGCALNVVSWENGDTTITDFPPCTDRLLARIVQNVNDNICTHRDREFLCPDCSIRVLALAHRTVGTGGASDLTRRRVWVRIAADQARQVLHLAANQTVALAAIKAAEAWADNPSEATKRDAYAAYAAGIAAAYAAAAYAATTTAAGIAAAYAAGDATATAAGIAAAGQRLELAHRAIDLFQQLTGRTAPPPDPTRTATAYAAMTTTEGN